MTPWNGRRRLTFCATLAAALVACSAAQALDLRLAGGLDAEYTTNVRRTDDAEDDLIALSWLGVQLEESSARWTGQVAAVVEQESYLENTLGDDLELAFAGSGELTLLPGNLYWHVEDYYQQVLINTLEPYGRDNTQDSNVFWTGPDLRLRIAQLYSLEVAARFGDYYYGVTESDNQRLALLSRFSRRWSEQSDFYVGSDASTVDYQDNTTLGPDGVPNSDFERLDLFAGYRYESSLTLFQIDAGATTVERDTLPDVDGPLLALSVRRLLARDQSIAAGYSYRLSESGAELLSTGGLRADADRSGASATQDIAEQSRLTVSYSASPFGGELDLRILALREDFEAATLDRRAVGGEAEYAMRFRPAWLVTASAGYRHTRYTVLDWTDHDSHFALEAEQRVTPHWTMGLGVALNHRDSNVVGRDFTEWVALLGVRYGERPSWTGR